MAVAMQSNDSIANNTQQTIAAAASAGEGAQAFGHLVRGELNNALRDSMERVGVSVFDILPQTKEGSTFRAAATAGIVNGVENTARKLLQDGGGLRYNHPFVSSARETVTPTTTIGLVNGEWINTQTVFDKKNHRQHTNQLAGSTGASLLQESAAKKPASCQENDLAAWYQGSHTPLSTVTQSMQPRNGLDSTPASSITSPGVRRDNVRPLERKHSELMSELLKKSRVLRKRVVYNVDTGSDEVGPPSPKQAKSARSAKRLLRTLSERSSDRGEGLTLLIGEGLQAQGEEVTVPRIIEAMNEFYDFLQPSPSPSTPSPQKKANAANRSAVHVDLDSDEGAFIL